MNRLFHLFIFSMLLIESNAQNVGIGTTTPHSSAKLDVQSQNSGMLLPRMNSAQRKAIGAPATGLLVFDTDKNAFMFWNGLEWEMLVPANGNQGRPSETMNPGNEDVNNFGYQVAISGNFAAISAMVSYSDNSAGYRVYIYEKTASGWIKKQEIFSPDNATSKSFGYDLDMDGEYLVISDFTWKNAANVSVGKIYVYRRNNGNYTFDSGIQSISTTSDGFGKSVAVSQSATYGLMIAVGMPFADAVIPARTNAGRVVLFKKSNNSWLLVQSIQPSEMQANDQTGFSVDLNGGLLVFGAPFRQSSSGGVYVYEFQSASNNWQRTASYFSSSNSTDDLLGYSVSAGTGMIAAGRPNFNLGEKGTV
ncbi:MAG: hypothetical protein J7527_11745, partial [Chitinophagaceae bacterium]|nr:hypothetical protein [Chitinophagaceae bacterium]